MTREDAKFMAGFIARMGMYICPDDKHGVVSFIDGYEAGSHGRCKFTRLVAKHLTEHLRIPQNSFGWPGQIEEFASRQGVKWLEAFILIASAVLAGGLSIRSANQQMCKKAIAAPKGNQAKRKPVRPSKK